MAPTDLFFRLTAYVGTEAVTDDVTVHLIPPAGVGGSGGGGAAPSPGGGDLPNAAGTGSGPTPTPSGSPITVSAAISGSQSVLQVPTEANGQLIGTGTGNGSLTYSWTQTSGPTAAIAGSSAGQPTLQFLAPLLDVDVEEEMLGFELTVTDSTGSSATTSAQVQVIWGDDGLQVSIDSGAGTAAASVDSPLSLTSAVSSRGTPYSYLWSSSDFDLSSSGSTTAAVLTFTTPAQAATGIVELEVTDSFGRTTTAQIEVVVTELPPGQLPQAFCDALNAISEGQTANLTGDGFGVTISTATLSGAAAPCSASTTATISNGSAVLAGGVTLSAITGQLSVAGVSITSATVTTPSAWALTGSAIGASGLLLPFISISAIGVPSGTIVATSMPVISLPQWTGSTTIQFTPDLQSPVSITAVGDGPQNAGSISLTGSASADRISLAMSGTGLVTIASVDIPVSGGVVVVGSEPPVFTTTASLATPVAIGASTQLSAATLSWTPTQTTGTVSLSIGTSPGAIALTGQASVNVGQTTLVFAATMSPWVLLQADGPVEFTGSGTIGTDSLSLKLQSAAPVAVSITSELSLNGLTASITAQCPLDGSQACAPAVSLTASATSPLSSTAFTVSGNFDDASSTVTLTGTVPSLSITPVTVTAAQVSIGLATGQVPTATAVGTATILQSARPTMVAFTPQGTIATAQIGSQSISSSWTIPDTIAVATTASLTYSPPSGPLAGQVSIPIAAQQLTGVGVTEIPATFASGVLPDDVTTALASFPITGSVATVQLVAPIPNGWYLAGAEGSPVSFMMQSIGFTVTPSSTPTVTITGSAILSTASVSASGGSITQSFTVSSGNLASGANGGVMSATFTPTVASNSAFGIDGLTMTGLSVTADVSAGSSTVSLSGLVTLPSSLANELGLPPTAAPTLSALLGAQDPCLAIDLAGGGGTGVDFGNYGFIVAPSAFLVIAPSACTTAAGTSVQQGLSLIIDSGFLDLTDPSAPTSVALAVDPSTFAVSDTISDVSIVFGGYSLSSADIAISAQGGVTSISVVGQVSIAGTTVQFTGSVVPPTAPYPALGSLTLSTQAASLPIGDLTITDAVATISGPSVLGAANAEISLVGTARIFGSTISMKLSGTASNGAIESLEQHLPKTKYVLGGGSGTDTLETDLRVVYSATPSPSTAATTSGSSTTCGGAEAPPSESSTGPTLSITGVGGVLRTTSEKFEDVSISVDGAMTNLSVKAPVAFIDDDADRRVSISGVYPLSGSNIGGYCFENPTQVDGFISGLSQKVTVSYARNEDGSESGLQESTMTLGVLDDDTEFELQGALSTQKSVRSESLSTTSAPTVTFRGLTGAMQIDVSEAGAGSTLPYDVVPTFTTTSESSCEMWKVPPVLTGLFYRTATTTYYTLHGPVEPVLPGLLDVATISFSQPLVVSNEYLPGSAQSPNSISLIFPVKEPMLAGNLSISFGIADCSYSLTGSVTVVIQGGAVAQELMSVLQPPAGLSVNVGSLFGSDGGLPPTITQARQVYAFESRQHAIAHQAQQAQDAANAASAEQRTAQANADAAQGQATEANAAEAAAAANYRNSFDKYTAAVTQAASKTAEAAQQLDNARRQYEAMWKAYENAQAEVDRTAAESSTRQGELEAANAELAERQNEAAQEQNQNQAAQNAKLLQLTLSVTYCQTCVDTWAASITGEAYYGILVAGLDLGFDFGEDGVTVDLGIQLGVEFQHPYGSSHIGFFLSASLVISASGSYAFGEGLQDIDATLQAPAQADLYVSTDFFNWTADLASIDLTGTAQIVPWPPTYSGSYSFYGLGLSWSGQWGGDAGT
jgi:hypothetical protein